MTDCRKSASSGLGRGEGKDHHEIDENESYLCKRPKLEKDLIPTHFLNGPK